MQKAIQAVVFIVLIGVLLFIGLVPAIVDNALNHTLGKPLPEPEESITQLHQTLFVADLHADSLLWGRNLAEGYHRGLVDLPKLQAGNVALQGFSVVTQSPRGLNYESNPSDSDTIFWLGLAQAWPPAALKNLSDRALLQAERLHQAAEDSQGQLRVIRNQQDLQDFLLARQEDPALIAGWLSLEGSHALEGDLANLERLEDAGFRMLSPTHFFDNAIGGSAHGEQQGGLTDLGREWVREMNERSLIIDLAHASPATFDEVMALSERPVMVSHTGVRGTCDNNRNLSDEQLDALKANGGLVGIGFWDAAVCETSVDAIVQAILYTRERIGVEHVALGSDFDGAVITPFDASQMSQLTAALLAQGLPEKEIAAIMGGNVRDFLLANLPSG